MRQTLISPAVAALTAVLAACGQAPSASQPQQPIYKNTTRTELLRSAQELILLTQAKPEDEVYLIDGDTNQVYQVQSAPPADGSAAILRAQNVKIVSLTRASNVSFEQELIPAPSLKAQAATCGSSDGPYYKNVYQNGATGFRHDIILPASTNVATSNTGAFLYGGYATSSNNVEVGFQRTASESTWQMYFAIAASGRYDAPDTNGTWSSAGWRMNDVRAYGGTTVNFNSRTEIGSDGLHYLVTDVSSGSNSYKIGYRTGGTLNLNISSLRPSNAANIEVRKVVALAGGGLTSASYINDAKFRLSQYRSASGTLATWPNTSSSRCTYKVSSVALSAKYNTAEASGSDTVSINNP